RPRCTCVVLLHRLGLQFTRMNGRTTARRRTTAVAASAAGDKEGVHNNNDARRRQNGHSPDRARRYARRKGMALSRIKRICQKLGNLRVVDVALFAAAAAKLVSIIYSYTRRRASASLGPMPSSTPIAKHAEPIHHNPLLRKQLKRWEEHQMPFHSPLLYRREDDDYSFGHDTSYLDYDGVAHRQTKKKIKLKGMFRADSYFKDNEEHLHAHGYAVVDDVLYDADDQREETRAALDASAPEFWDLDEEEYWMDASHKVEKEVRMHYFFDDDGHDYYYSFDDDLVRGTRGMGIMDPDEIADLREKDKCTPPAFYRTYHPTCNEFHASLSGYEWLLGEEIYARRWKRGKQLAADQSRQSKYLSHGYYRDAFLFQPMFSATGKGEQSTQWDEVVFKTMRHLYESTSETWEDDVAEAEGFGFVPEDKYTFQAYQEDMRKDAMLMELLSNSPRAIDIYAHCAMSSVMEFAPTDIEEYAMPTIGQQPKLFVRRGEQTNPDLPLNDYISPDEKLEMALEMAKCLASMHGYADGAIAHVDVQMGQFFRGRDGMLKIVDFNRAEALLYDTENEKYCQWTNGVPADGTYRAPEEQLDAPLTEKIDVYSLGNVFYSLLTGRQVWYAQDDEDEKIRRIVEGEILEIPAVYSETPSSDNLVRAIRACWTLDAEVRPSIFEVVDFLERAVAASVNNEKYDRPPR
ncbi:hypothetical protein ACHAXT_000612, partial [Thalassiosira profunda]